MRVYKKGLRRCPLCGTNAMAVHVNGHTWNISCGVEDDDSDSCHLVLFGGSGETRRQMFDRWNRRFGEDRDE